MKTFIDREEELEFLRNYILRFPLPRDDSPRPRHVLLLVGPKGVGKTALLRRLMEESLKDTVFVYVEFRGPYSSFEDLLIDMLLQVYESLKKLKSPWLNVLIKVLKVLGIAIEKTLGEEGVIDRLSDILTSPDTIEKLRNVKPMLMLKKLEEELCKVAEERNVRLVTIYDEFQNFLKIITSSESRYRYLLDTFMTYLSKTQEWGFDTRRGYPIRILAASDFTTYKYLVEKYLGVYITVMYLEELKEEYAVELLNMLLNSYGIRCYEPFLQYAINMLGGNPSIILRFVDKLRELKTSTLNEAHELVPEIIDEVVDALIEDEISKLRALDSDERQVVKILYDVLRNGEEEFVSIEELEKYSKTFVKDFKSVFESLLEKNILRVANRYKVGFQNKLLMHAVEELVKRKLL